MCASSTTTSGVAPTATSRSSGRTAAANARNGTSFVSDIGTPTASITRGGETWGALGEWRVIGTTAGSPERIVGAGDVAAVPGTVGGAHPNRMVARGSRTSVYKLVVATLA